MQGLQLIQKCILIFNLKELQVSCFLYTSVDLGLLVSPERGFTGLVNSK